MEIAITELLFRAGIEAANKWAVNEKTQIVHTTASKVVFPGPSMEAITVSVESFLWNHYVLGMGYCAEADVLVLSSEPEILLGT